MKPENVTCVCCGELPAVNDGCCSVCMWAVRAEVEDGLFQLGAYLARHAAFDAWLVAHGVPA